MHNLRTSVLAWKPPICTPTLDHKAIAVDAMRSGRPVLTEKPMARTVADCRRMNDVGGSA